MRFPGRKARTAVAPGVGSTVWTRTGVALSLSHVDGESPSKGYLVRLPTLLTIASLALCASTVQPLLAQQGRAPGVQIGAKDDLRAIPATDRTFLEKAAQVGQAEVQAGALASAKASSENVRNFAQEMLQNHSKVRKELEGLAAAKGIKLPDRPGTAQEDALKELERLSGSEFDRRYLADSGIRDQEISQRIFREARKNTLDPDLQSLIDRALPTITKQLETARKLASSN